VSSNVVPWVLEDGVWRRKGGKRRMMRNMVMLMIVMVAIVISVDVSGVETGSGGDRGTESHLRRWRD